jgi:hypothetical protein
MAPKLVLNFWDKFPKLSLITQEKWENLTARIALSQVIKSGEF